MNDKKIAVIAQRIGAGHSAMWSHLGEIDVLQGYEVELIEVPSGGAVAATYQRAMKASDAKYKVYLSSGSILLRPSFFHDMLQLFVQNPSIGAMGLVGTKQLSTTGIFEKSSLFKGKLLFSDGSRFEGADIEGSMDDVMVISGDMIATQYDIPWRMDLFQQDCFWAEAQCVEFKRKGYRVVVPRQKAAWLLTKKWQEGYDEVSQQAFLDTYSKDIYPLVSIIIPTYQRPHYFRLALESVLAQTYRNLDIFITDNSHNTETAKMMRRDFADDPRIHYEHHPDYSERENWACASSYDNSHAKYVNWLMDDDLFLPDKIAVMVDWMASNPDVSLVTSYRELIDGDGNKLPDFPATKPLVQKSTKFNGEIMGRNMLLYQMNGIGEPTTPLLRKSLLLHGHDLGFTGEEGKYFWSDFPTWLHLCCQGDIVYLRTPLSQFRLHKGNEQSKLRTKARGQISWAIVTRSAIEQDMFLHDLEIRRKTILQWLLFSIQFLQEASLVPEAWELPEYRDFLTVFLAMSEALRKGCQISFCIDTTPVLQPIENGK